VAEYDIDERFAPKGRAKFRPPSEKERANAKKTSYGVNGGHPGGLRTQRTPRLSDVSRMEIMALVKIGENVSAVSRSITEYMAVSSTLSIYFIPMFQVLGKEAPKLPPPNWLNLKKPNPLTLHLMSEVRQNVKRCRGCMEEIDIKTAEPNNLLFQIEGDRCYRFKREWGNLFFHCV